MYSQQQAGKLGYYRKRGQYFKENIWLRLTVAWIDTSKYLNVYTEDMT